LQRPPSEAGDFFSRQRNGAVGNFRTRAYINPQSASSHQSLNAGIKSPRTHQRPAGISQRGAGQTIIYPIAYCDLVLVRMCVPPIPVFRLFFPVGLREFMRFPVILCIEAHPRAVLILIPVVIVLVLSIINAIFMIAIVILLRPTHSFARDGHSERCYH